MRFDAPKQYEEKTLWLSEEKLEEKQEKQQKEEPLEERRQLEEKKEEGSRD